MCIVLITTAHPKYALIVLDNRDEFILRPTSRPHWWTAKASQHAPANGAAAPATTTTAPHEIGQAQNGDSRDEVQHILASRDLLRAEQGTWLGVTKTGHFAVLTNYRELAPGSGAPSVSGAKSRGGMVTAWLGSPASQTVAGFAEAMIAEGGTRGVGGFSLICGKLRRRRGGQGDGGGGGVAGEGAAGREDGMEPLAVLSNKAAHPDEIPWIAGGRGETVGLSNAAFDAPTEWPKVTKGKALLDEVVAKAVAKGLGEEELREGLLEVLSRDELPKSPEMKFEDYFKVLHESIFIPPVGSEEQKDAMAQTAAKKVGNGHADPQLIEALDEVEGAQRPDPHAPPPGFNTGMYGTQRQTVMLVDWDGNVTYTERSLFDEHGSAIEKGKGDATFRFAIDGWDQSG